MCCIELEDARKDRCHILIPLALIICFIRKLFYSRRQQTKRKSVE